MQTNRKDVLVIGGGIVGTSILRALSFYDLDIALVEKEPDVCEGTSKANSGIIHTGFDAKPGTVEADCLRRSREQWPSLVEKLRIPYLPCGAVMVATTPDEWNTIRSVYVPNAEANGVEVHLADRETIREMNPDVHPSVIGGLVIPGESICDPFWATRANAELAVLNGAEILLGSMVTGIRQEKEGFVVALDDGQTVHTRYLVNAAGLWSDEIARMVGDDSFTITPRKGEFILTEESFNLSQIILPVPTKKSKGVLVSPVVFGGFLLGPTAEDTGDKLDRSTTAAGLEFIRSNTSKLVPCTAHAESIRQFAGVRAVSSTGDFIIRPSDRAPRMIHAAGIRSTGLSASPGIADLVVECLREAGLDLQGKTQVTESLKDLFEDDSEAGDGEIVCLCRSITRGEIRRALNRPLAPRTIDGVKRRTGATLGECQGNYCIPRIMDLIRLASGQPDSPILKGIRGSILTRTHRRGGDGSCTNG